MKKILSLTIVLFSLQGICQNTKKAVEIDYYACKKAFDSNDTSFFNRLTAYDYVDIKKGKKYWDRFLLPLDVNNITNIYLLNPKWKDNYPENDLVLDKDVIEILFYGVKMNYKYSFKRTGVFPKIYFNASGKAPKINKLVDCSLVSFTIEYKI